MRGTLFPTHTQTHTHTLTHTGEGVLHVHNGDKYRGEFADHRIAGQGTMDYANGDRWVTYQQAIRKLLQAKKGRTSILLMLACLEQHAACPLCFVLCKGG